MKAQGYDWKDNMEKRLLATEEEIQQHFTEVTMYVDPEIQILDLKTIEVYCCKIF